MTLAVLTASRWSSALTAFPAHRGHLPRLGAAEVLEGYGQLAQDAVPRLLQLAVRPPLLERPSLRRRARRRAQLQLGVKRGHQREELRQLLVGAGTVKYILAVLQAPWSPTKLPYSGS